MALIKCSECGREISDKAAACIHCGCPVSASKTTTFAGHKVVQTGNKTLNDFLGENSAVQFTSVKKTVVKFHAVLSGGENERSQQSVYVKELGRNVTFMVPNTIHVGQSVMIHLQNGEHKIQFQVESISRAQENKQAAPINTVSNQEAITLLKNYKPNLLVRFFKTGFIKKCISMTLAFVVAGRFGDVDMEAVILFAGIGILLLWLGSLYPLANIKSYCKKHHIDEAIRKDTGNMNVAINAFNALPTTQMLTYIKKLNPAAAQEIERQLAAKKK